MKITRSTKCSTRHLTTHKKSLIETFMSEYTRLCNIFIPIIETHYNANSKVKKQELLIKGGIANQDTWLSARAIQDCKAEAFVLVTSTKKACAATDNAYCTPVHKGNRIVLSSKCIRIDLLTNTTFDINIRLHSIGNKIQINIPLRKYRNFNKYDINSLNNYVILSKNYIQFTFTYETGKKKLEGENLGIDIGCNKLVACSDGVFVGTNLMKLINKLHRKVRSSLSYKKCKIEIKEYINRNLKKIPFDKLRLIVCEKLRNLKQKMKVKRRLTKNIRRVISSWNYAFVLERIEMLCEENRVSFRSVNPFYTSQTCSICGHRDKKNRLSQESFCCQKCGHTDNADINASEVILSRFVTGKYGSCFQT